MNELERTRRDAKRVIEECGLKIWGEPTALDITNRPYTMAIVVDWNMRLGDPPTSEGFLSIRWKVRSRYGAKPSSRHDGLPVVVRASRLDDA